MISSWLGPHLFIFESDKHDQIRPYFELICSNLFISLHIMFSTNQICTVMRSSKCWRFFKESPPSPNYSNKEYNKLMHFFKRELKIFLGSFYRKWFKLFDLAVKNCRKIQPTPFTLTFRLLYFLEMTPYPVYLHLRVVLQSDFSLQN